MRLRKAVVLLACAQAACAGRGGGGDEAPIAVTFSPAPVHACAQAGWTGNAVVATIAALEAIPLEVVRTNVSVTGTALNPSVAITPLGANRFGLSTHASSGLAPGTHEGTISFELCEDAGCAHKHPLSGATLPYAVEVLADPVLVVSSGGASVAGSGMFQNDFAIAVGAQVTITADRPVVWEAGRSSGFTALDPIAVTSITWIGTVVGGTSEWIEVRAIGSCDGAPLGVTGIILDLQ